MNIYATFALVITLSLIIFSFVVYHMGWLGVGCFVMSGIATLTLYSALNLISRW